jgi:hypothetical protein
VDGLDDGEVDEERGRSAEDVSAPVAERSVVDALRDGQRGLLPV